MPVQIPSPSVYGDEECGLVGEDWTVPSAISTASIDDNHDNGEFLDEVFETNFQTWKKYRWILPECMQTLTVLIQDHPNDWHQPVFSGYLLKETTKRSGGVKQDPILKLIPKPKTAFMSLQQFWETEITSRDAGGDCLPVLTRHGMKVLDVKSIVSWIMEVEDEILEIPEPSSEEGSSSGSPVLTPPSSTTS